MGLIAKCMDEKSEVTASRMAELQDPNYTFPPSSIVVRNELGWRFKDAALLATDFWATIDNVSLATAQLTFDSAMEKYAIVAGIHLQMSEEILDLHSRRDAKIFRP